MSLSTEYCFGVLRRMFRATYSAGVFSLITSRHPDTLSCHLEWGSTLSVHVFRMDGCGRCIDNIFIERLWRSNTRRSICTS